MKPSWDDAPEWANWLVMDGDGMWLWHEYKPDFLPASSGRMDWWMAPAGSRVKVAQSVMPSSVNTLEPRP